MKQDTHITHVKFYIEPTRSVMAYFPKTKGAFNGYRNDLRECYATIGQHSSCAPEYLKKCKLATPEQYKDLVIELEGLGYNLKILNSKQ